MEATAPNVILGVTWGRRLRGGRGLQRGWRGRGQNSGRGSHSGLYQLGQFRGRPNGHSNGNGDLLGIQL